MYMQADLREPEKILANPAVRRTIDFDQPVALMLVAILHFIPMTTAIPRASWSPCRRRSRPVVTWVATHVSPEDDPPSA